jgi:hypothetical protein
VNYHVPKGKTFYGWFGAMDCAHFSRRHGLLAGGWM